MQLQSNNNIDRSLFDKLYQEYEKNCEYERKDPDGFMKSLGFYEGTENFLNRISQESFQGRLFAENIRSENLRSI